MISCRRLSRENSQDMGWLKEWTPAAEDPDCAVEPDSEGEDGDEDEHERAAPRRHAAIVRPKGGANAFGR